MSDGKQRLDRLHADLGLKPLNRTWAKVELLVGLAAAGIGMLLGQRTMAQRGMEIDWPMTGAALALFVLGWYLALAGHRSHLYQSNNDLTAYLAEQIRGTKQ